jgi:hypothetical protein
VSDMELMLVEDADESWAELERREVFRTSDPVELVRNAAAVATELARIVEEKKLYQVISGKRHVKVEGWTLLGSMLRVYPVLVWSRRLDDGWEARVEARTLDGTIVGAAESQCLRSEPRWKTRDDYAIRSMAQTRATSKALKMPLGFVFSMAGYETTPADEMPHEPEPDAPKAATQGQGLRIASLMKTLEEYDPATDWGAWCREHVSVESFLTLDELKAATLIAGLQEKVAELAPEPEPATPPAGNAEENGPQ